MDPVDVLIRRIDPQMPLPAYQHPGDAGLDLHTAADATLAPGERGLLPTGIALAMPRGYFAFVVPRSGLAVRYGVSLVNSPGTIDAGYRGEVRVSVINLDAREPVSFVRGDRIAQLIVQQVPEVRLHEVEQLPGSQRAAGGFGSTGGHAEGSAAHDDEGGQ